MQHVLDGYRGLSIILTVNMDRLASLAMVATGLILGAVMGSLLLAV